MLASKEGLPGVVGLLAEHCVKGLSADQHAVIAARVHAGKDIRAVGDLLNYSRPHAARRWDEVKDVVLVPLGLHRHDDLLAGLWVMLHADCCTAPCMLMLKNDSRFQSRR